MEEKGTDALEMAEKKNAPKKKKAEVNKGAWCNGIIMGSSYGDELKKGHLTVMNNWRDDP